MPTLAFQLFQAHIAVHGPWSVLSRQQAVAPTLQVIQIHLILDVCILPFCSSKRFQKIKINTAESDMANKTTGNSDTLILFEYLL